MAEEQVYKLFDMGVLTQLNIGYWSCYKMLTREDLLSLGIDSESIPDLVNLGRKLLVPKEERANFSEMESKARNALKRWSVPFPVIGAYFVPLGRLAQIQESIIELQKEFSVRVDSFIKRFNEIKEQIKQEYPEFWEKCLSTCYPPTPEALRDKFYFRFMSFKISGVQNAQMTESSVEELMAQNDAVKHRSTIVQEQMRDEMNGFVKEYMSTLRNETVEFCNMMTARLEGKPWGTDDKVHKFTGKTINAFRKHIDRFCEMNIFGDEDVEKLLKDLKQQYFFEADGKSFNNPALKQSLLNALGTIKEAAKTDTANFNSLVGEIQRKVVL